MNRKQTISFMMILATLAGIFFCLFSGFKVMAENGKEISLNETASTFNISEVVDNSTGTDLLDENSSNDKNVEK